MAIKITKEEFAQKFGKGQAPSIPQSQGGGMGNTISDAFQSGLQQTKAGFQEAGNATNPLQLLEGGVKTAAGVVNTLFSPLAPVTKPLGQAIDFVGNKISDNPNVQNFANSPAGETTARIAENVGNVATIAGAVAGGKGTGQVAGKVADASIPAINATGRILKNAGEKAYGITITPEEATAQAVRKYNAKGGNLVERTKNMISGEQPVDSLGNPLQKPITESNTAARLGLAGTEKGLGIQATKAATDLWSNTISPALKNVKGKVDMKSFLGEIEKEIKNSTKGRTRRADLLEGLQKMKEDYKGVGKVSLEMLQRFKEEDWAKFIPEASYKGKPIGSAFKEIQNLAAKKARGVIYKHAGPEAKQAYIDYGNLQSIIKAADKSVIGDAAKKSLGRNVWQFVMDTAVTPIATVAGKVLYRTGEGLEFVGNSGAKKVGDIVEGGLNSNNPQNTPK